MAQYQGLYGNYWHGDQGGQQHPLSNLFNHPSGWLVCLKSLITEKIDSMRTRKIISFFQVLIPGFAQISIDLTGPGWALSNANGSIKVPATLPSQQYIDLFNAGIIGDPLFGSNNTLQSWIALENWTYTSPPWSRLTPSITLDDPDINSLLVFQGLDTFALIELCNQSVGNTNNQFRQYVFDVTNIVQSCNETPQLSINFGSPVTLAYDSGSDSRNDPLAAEIDGCTQDNKLACKAFARKQQNDAGWDWSPSLEPSGPWRPIYLVQGRPGSVYINNVLIDIYRKNQKNNLPPDQTQPWTFNTTRVLLPSTSISANTITGSLTIDPSTVELWWPNGIGSQPLYNATVLITDQQALPIKQVSRRVGFRTIVLNLGLVTDDQIAKGIAPGANWHFEINGQEFYAKGSNFVPPDAFWPRVNATRITRLFELAQEAGMNMLRVWSSGAYLDDWIYDQADEMGILLWSEFEFSDAQYSNATSFLQNYEAEAYYNVRRVNHHPSLALWAGGNELEAIQLAFFFLPDSPSAVMQQYQQIFEELLITCVYSNTRSISYIPSSTYNGYLNLNFSSARPQMPRYMNDSKPGYFYNDTDSYNYDAATLFDINTYPVGRFANEFGFHSMPSLYTWEWAAPPEDLYYPSQTVINHNRHYPFGSDGTVEQQSMAGIAEMTEAVVMWLPRPDIQDTLANFSAWCWSTQVVQADDIARQIAFYRRGSGRSERQLGSLYWMFDDMWAAPTWASVEANNRQKVLYYSVKDIYQPVIVGAYYNQSNGELEIWSTSDLWTSVSGTLEYTWTNWHGDPIPIGKPVEGPAPFHHGTPDPTNQPLPFRPMQGSGGKGFPKRDQASSQCKKSTATTTTTTTTTIPFAIGPINSTQILRYPNLHESLASANVSFSDALLHLSITAKLLSSAQNSSSAGGKVYSHSSTFHPSPLSQVSIPDPGLTLKRDENVFTVTATKAQAAWVWLEYGTNEVQGYWSSNGFWLAKGETREVTFTIWEDWSGGKWAESVFVRSIWDLTQTEVSIVRES